MELSQGATSGLLVEAYGAALVHVGVVGPDGPSPKSSLENGRPPVTVVALPGQNIDGWGPKHS